MFLSVGFGGCGAAHLLSFIYSSDESEERERERDREKESHRGTAHSDRRIPLRHWVTTGKTASPRRVAAKTATSPAKSKPWREKQKDPRNDGVHSKAIQCARIAVKTRVTAEGTEEANGIHRGCTGPTSNRWIPKFEYFDHVPPQAAVGNPSGGRKRPTERQKKK